MASSEVNMHVEEVVVVTTPDGTAHGNAVEEVKTMLITTDLTQAGEDMSRLEDTESISIPKDAVLVKLSEEVDPDVLYSITCGDSKATLIWKKFVCPGINIKCVQFNEHLISPKEFVYLAGKSTLKDWKRAIRLNGAMLRKIMDSGELDFYQHSKVCSNTCRSTKIDLVGSRASLSSQQSIEFLPATPCSADVNGSPATLASEASEDSTEWVTAIGEDTMTFWRGVKEAGLLEEIMEDLQREIQDTLQGLQDRLQEPPLQVNDAVLLNNIVQNFGMLDLVKKVLSSHKSQMDRCREQYTRSLVALEQQLDEHRKCAKELKSKSQHLNNVLMTLTPVTTPPAPKRPRLTRTVSVPASIISHQSQTASAVTQPTQFAVPLTQLAGIPLGKVISAMGSPASGQTPLLGSYTVLASSGDGHLQTDASNLTVLSTAAVQEGAAPGSATFVKVVSPFQILTLPNLVGTNVATIQNVAGAGPVSTVVAVPVSTTVATTNAAHVETVGSQTEEAPGSEVKTGDNQ
ncbi:glucocorticoid modulatory element-binding protein 2 [Denticeps clupeoides]|uniref:SAND domain-containing protein n=1 Tax=Denticeps clupeoides TaxID=299321 RepID=A0AAY4ES27_9TELE|nr:glucocorticoid modulatory element-binding protein 2 [Denticeps clupeoides]XP_028849923.1 glucocorticoid modulatory element-binding protein 2 [Denticeps clupeoides]